jgi:hypothetical protein
MTIQSLAKLLMRDLGLRTLTPAGSVDNSDTRGPGAGDLDAVCAAINGAYVELWNRSPSAMFERRTGGVLYPPTTVTVSCTQYSNTISITSGYASWMIGCTIVFASGDTSDNEILETNTQLLRPFMGATGSYTATVYCDAILLPSTDIVILDPVEIRGQRVLLPASSWEELQRFSGVVRTMHGYNSVGYGSAAMNKLSGQPLTYWVDTRYEQTGTATRSTFLRFGPMPSAPFPIDYRLLATPPVVTSADIDNGDHSTDPGTLPIVWFPELTLYAVARQHLSGDPLFTNVAARAEIMRQYELAIHSLANVKPQGTSQQASNAMPVFRGRRGSAGYRL